jgi:predicted lipid-binding transport protein (Tim44 family)
MLFGFWTSAAAFVVIEGDALLDQSAIGHASTLYMFGTACLAAAACIGLFAIISTIGLTVSPAFSDGPPQQQSDHSQDAAAAADAHISHRPAASPALARSSSRRPRQPPRIHALAKEVRKAPPQAL